MEILKIEVYKYSIPMVPFTIATGTMHFAQNILIRIHTNTEHIGIGECSAFPMIVGETQATCYEMAKDFAAIWKNKNALDIDARLAELDLYTARNFTAKSAFANREISAAVSAMANDVAMRDEKNDLVKAPVEWFISACRALGLTPSQLKTPAQLLNYLDKLGQVPFSPPNVGGWPAGEAWLSSATAQYRIAFAAWLIKQSDLSALTSIPVASRVLKSADWLGVAEWSARTQAALRDSVNDPAQFALLALCSPEYVVSA